MDFCFWLQEGGVVLQITIMTMVVAHGDPTSLAPYERLTDLAVVPREKPHTGAHQMP